MPAVARIRTAIHRAILMHTIERQTEQLAAAGISEVPVPELSWANSDVDRFRIQKRFVILVPGGAAHRPDKRWPEDRYAALAQHFLTQRLTPVLVGGPDEQDLCARITAAAPGTRDLTGETSLIDLAGLARRAAAAVGNDTGPMHLMAVAGCASIVLYSHVSDPALCGQRGAIGRDRSPAKTGRHKR